jgi:hypothetical protein
MEVFGEAIGGQAEGFHELREEDLAGMDGESEGDLIHGCS